MRRSHASASSHPPPRANPDTAAITHRGMAATASSARTNAAADRAGVVGPTELADVGARREQAVAPGDDDGARRVVGQGAGGRFELAEQLGGQGVDLRVVEADHRHAVGAALGVHERGVSGHRPTLPAGRRRVRSAQRALDRRRQQRDGGRSRRLVERPGRRRGPAHPGDRRVDPPPRRRGHGRVRRPPRAPPVRAGRRPADGGVRGAPRAGRGRRPHRRDRGRHLRRRAGPAGRHVRSGLAERLPPGVEVEGAGAFRTRLGLAPDRPRRRRAR